MIIFRKSVKEDNEEDNAKSIEWHSINEQIDDLMPYQQYALDMYNKNSNLSFTMFGWNK